MYNVYCFVLFCFVLFCFVSIKRYPPGFSEVRLAYADVQLTYRLIMKLTDVSPPTISRNGAILTIIGTGFYPIPGGFPACK